MLAAAAAVLLLLHSWETRRQNTETPEDPYVGQEESLTYYNGAWYARRELETVLVMGVDKYASDAAAEEDSYVNQEQADFLLLLVLDRETGVCTALPLNRDTMTEITALGLAGERVGTFTGQLALAHTYGSGGSDSCLNAKKAVSKLLGGVSIDHYMSFTMDSVPTVNDSVGGVSVTVLDDFKNNQDLRKGEEVTLHGEEALLYVRGRQNAGDQTNLSRMKRQEQYMTALMAKLMDAARGDADFLTKLTFRLGDSFQTDYSVSQLQTLADTMLEAKIEPFLTIDGEAQKGEEFMEYYVDATSLEKTIQTLFYE